MLVWPVAHQAQMSVDLKGERCRDLYGRPIAGGSVRMTNGSAAVLLFDRSESRRLAKNDDERTSEDERVRPSGGPAVGSYANIMKVTDPVPRALSVQSVAGWSADDPNATVQALLETGQTLWGYGIADCLHWQGLPALLRLARGTPLRIFALIPSHHPLPTFCGAWRDNNGTGNLSYTKLATTLAALALAEPALEAFSIDDFFVGQTQPGPPGGQSALPTGGTQNRSVIVQMHAAMKRLNPAFSFWPTIYPSQLGIAFRGGFFLGATDGVPFDGNASARLQLQYTGRTPLSTVVLRFKYLCAFCPPGKATVGAPNVWRGKIFMRVSVGDRGLMDVDMLALPDAPYPGQLFERDIGGLGTGENVTFELYSRDANGRNMRVHKMANIYMLSLKVDGREVVGTSELAVRLSATPSAGATAPSNTPGGLFAVRSDEYSVPMDGLLMPFPMQPIYAPDYRSCLDDARALLPRPRKLLGVHYVPSTGVAADTSSDSASLAALMRYDLEGGVADGSLVFALPLPLWGLNKRAGLFSEHKLIPDDPSGADLVAHFPKHQNGINSWFQRYTSRLQLGGNLTFTLQSPGRPTEGNEYFQARLYTVVGRDTTRLASLLYAASVRAVPCRAAASKVSPCSGAKVNHTLSGVGTACSMMCDQSGRQIVRSTLRFGRKKRRSEAAQASAGWNTAHSELARACDGDPGGACGHALRRRVCGGLGDT